VAASPCKGIGQWQLTNPAKGEFASNFFSKMFYGWIPHNAGFGFLDIPSAALGQIHF
jgi:hypothetical protein